MTQYSTGTVSINQSSINLVGSGTNWNTSPIAEGWFITFDSGNTWYEIAAVNNSTSINLTTQYGDSNLSSTSYTATDNILLYKEGLISVPANTLTGSTLSSSVVNSSLTNVGTLVNLAVSGNVNAEGNLVVNGDVDLGGNVNATGTLGSGADLEISGDAGINGNLAVTGTTTLSASVVARYSGSVSYGLKDLSQATDAKIWDIETDTGQLNFRVVNDTYSSANAWMYVTRSGIVPQKVSIPISTTSSSTSTGALVVSGGVGIGGALNLGGSANLVGALNLGGSASLGGSLALSAYGVGTLGVNNSGAVISSGFVTPQMYGCAGNGTTDDTTNLSVCLNSGKPVLLVGKFKISSQITINLTAGVGLYCTGAGQQLSQIICSTATAGVTINVTYTNNDVGTNSQVILKDLTFVASYAGIGASISGTPSGMLNILANPNLPAGFAGITAELTVIDNVSFLGDGTGWTYVGMYLKDLRYININVNMQGCIGTNNNTAGVANSAGIVFGTSNLSTSTNGNAPTALMFERCFITGGQYGVIFLPSGYTASTLPMDPQGVWLTNCVIIGQGTNSLSFTGSDQQSNEWHVKSCSFGCSGAITINAVNIGGLRVSDSTIINLAASSSSNYCIYYTLNPSSTQNNFTGGNINFNQFFGAGLTTAVGGVVNLGSGITLSTLQVAFNSSSNCGGGSASSAYSISGTAVSKTGNG